jgi:hypothetical protein
MNPHPDPHQDFFLDPHTHLKKKKFYADPQHWSSPGKIICLLREFKADK